MRISEFRYPETIARCQHIKINGVQCGSPSLKNKKFCFFHEKSRQRRLAMKTNRPSCWHLANDLPLLEDANSIQVALMQVMRLLMTSRIEYKEASLLLYALQTASSNLRNTSFEPRPGQVVIDRCGVADTSLGDDAWYKQEFEENDEEETDDSEEAVDIKACADPASCETLFRQNKGSNHRGSHGKGSHSKGSFNRGSYQGTPFRRAEKVGIKRPASAAGALLSTPAAKAGALHRLSGIAEAMP